MAYTFVWQTVHTTAHALPADIAFNVTISAVIIEELGQTYAYLWPKYCSVYQGTLYTRWTHFRQWTREEDQKILDLIGKVLLLHCASPHPPLFLNWFILFLFSFSIIAIVLLSGVSRSGPWLERTCPAAQVWPDVCVIHTFLFCREAVPWAVAQPPESWDQERAGGLAVFTRTSLLDSLFIISHPIGTMSVITLHSVQSTRKLIWLLILMQTSSLIVLHVSMLQWSDAEDSVIIAFHRRVGSLHWYSTRSLHYIHLFLSWGPILKQWRHRVQNTSPELFPPSMALPCMTVIFCKYSSFSLSTT